MTTVKRGRGRPKGSKNRPKVTGADLLSTGLTSPNPGGVVGQGNTGNVPGQYHNAMVRELRETQTLSDPSEASSAAPDKDIEEPLARVARLRFDQCRLYRAGERLGDSTTEAVLHQCHRQISGVVDPALAAAVEAAGVDLILNLTELKVDAFEAWSRSILTDSKDLPFTVEASPIPELSSKAKTEVLERLKVQLFGDEAAPLPADIPGLVRQLKSEQLELEKRYAEEAAEKHMRLLEDQCHDGDFRPALLDVIRDFATYPYAVMEGPIPTAMDVLKWNGSRLVKATVVAPKFRRRSPFDLFWTSDSTNTQNGTAVFTRDRMTRAQLVAAARLKSYIGENVINALERYSRYNVDRDWLNWNPERQRNMVGGPWGNDQSIEVLTMYSKLSGNELRPYGYSLDSHLFYETKVRTIGPYAIQVLINRAPDPFPRPIYTASMTKNGDRMAGRGLAQKLRDIERAYHAALRGLVRNVHYSSGPIGEVDYARIARWIQDDDIGNIDPYTIFPTDPDVSGGGRPAHYFHTVPSVAQAMIAVMQFFSQQADRFSQIPSAFHGEAVGTGVNRTFRGVTLLQGNALKGLQAALTNLGTGIITPTVRNLYLMNMMYSEDESIKGDTRPVVSDIAGLLEKEMAKQESMERLQFVAQIAQAGAVSPAVAAWVSEEALRAAGIPLSKLNAPSSPPAPAGGPPAGLPGAGPTPAVAPPDMGIAAPNTGPE